MRAWAAPRPLARAEKSSSPRAAGRAAARSRGGRGGLPALFPSAGVPADAAGYRGHGLQARVRVSTRRELGGAERPVGLFYRNFFPAALNRRPAFAYNPCRSERITGRASK